MVRTALTPPAETTTVVDARWIAQTADHILAVMEESRSTWQMWHVRAEAQRQVRTIDLPARQATALVDLLVDEVLNRRSVSLAAPPDGIEEPEALRRVDGSSVYTVAGAALYTSQRILDAETRLLAAAGRRDGSAVDQVAVDLALLEMAANGTALDAGQAALVRQMCTSGARAAAGDRPRRRRQDDRHARPYPRLDPRRRPGARPGPVGGRGRRPRRANRHPHRHPRQTHLVTAARRPAGLGGGGRPVNTGDHRRSRHGRHPLPRHRRPVRIERGASVRLIGDDQQLAAIGAGGVLRDITHTHGALRLTELHRFTDPAEAAASLALRDGDPRSLDFYLDHGRVHVGDLATTTEDAFNAWVSDRAAGLDTIMIAPTRDLVAELNRRARDHRLDQRTCSIRGAVGRRKPGQRRRCDHHPQQRPPTPPHRHRLGQERRPLDHHPCRQTR